MCGFIGSYGAYTDEEDLDYLSSSFSNRGPDSHGFFGLPNLLFSVFHRRLIIIEDSILGSQPIISKSSRYVLAFNGEIYNHLELRNLIPSCIFKSQSDSETLVNLFDFFEFNKVISLLDGMFSISLFDTKSDTLYLATDRCGEKPLYFSFLNGGLFFFSDPSAIYKHSAFNKEFNHKSVRDYFMYGYIPSEFSIFNNVQKVMPGHIYIFNKENIRNYSKQCYWSWNDSKSEYNLSALDFSDRKYLIKTSFEKAIKSRLLSDVPVGSFLSGGIDSSLVTAVASKFSTTLKTFSVGFDSDIFDESHASKKISSVFSTKHTSFNLDSSLALNLLEPCVSSFSEPFGDSSALPTYFLSSFASKDIKVALSGDGADEIFYGYSRYSYFNKILKYSNLLPNLIKSFLRTSFHSINNSNILQRVNFINKQKYRLQKFIDIFESNSLTEKYLLLVYKQISSSQIPISLSYPDSIKFTPSDKFDLDVLVQFIDILTYLPHDIFHKVDRASMVHSLEVRSPFVSNDLLYFSRMLPYTDKTKHSLNKYLLRSLLSDYLPRDLINAKKKGFGIPLANWLNGDWRNFIIDLFSSQFINEIPFHCKHHSDTMLTNFLNGNTSLAPYLWRYMMFFLWYKRFYLHNA